MPGKVFQLIHANIFLIDSNFNITLVILSIEKVEWLRKQNEMDYSRYRMQILNDALSPLTSL